MSYPQTLENVIEEFRKLPGIGRRSAERIAFSLLERSREETEQLASSINQLKERLTFCRICNNLSDSEICTICNDPSRDKSIICIVEDPKDLIAIERCGVYKGSYHVLLGRISPTEGYGPDSLKIHQLLTRIKTGGIKEIVIATDPDNEGEMTSLYLMKQLKPFNIKITRIGIGLPVGSAVEYADISTLSTSFKTRREM